MPAETQNDIAVLKIDGEEYRLRYDFNEIADAETVCGCNLLAPMEDISLQSASANSLRGLLYAMVRACPYDKMPARPDVLLREVGDLVRIDTLMPIRQAIGEAILLGGSDKFVAEYQRIKGTSGDADQPPAPPAAPEAPPQG